MSERWVRATRTNAGYRPATAVYWLNMAHVTTIERCEKGSRLTMANHEGGWYADQSPEELLEGVMLLRDSQGKLK